VYKHIKTWYNGANETMNQTSNYIMNNQRSKTLYKFNEATATAEWTVMKHGEIQMVVQMSPGGISFASSNGAMGYSNGDQLQDLQEVMAVSRQAKSGFVKDAMTTEQRRRTLQKFNSILAGGSV
jgi:hypothetical protein|tara:strand:+ start:484 stop:855 length:372 start_codon:yes stop_codon:yes gene_type:complete